MKRFLLLTAAFTCFAALVSPAAPGARGLMVGLFDESETLGNPERAFPLLDTLGAKTIRTNLYWGGPIGVARKGRPAKPTDPADPTYDWFAYDRMVRMADERG